MVKRVDALYECFKTQTKIKYFVKKLTQIVFAVIKTLKCCFWSFAARIKTMCVKNEGSYNQQRNQKSLLLPCD
jgi:hypothetical protein